MVLFLMGKWWFFMGKSSRNVVFHGQIIYKSWVLMGKSGVYLGFNGTKIIIK